MPGVDQNTRLWLAVIAAALANTGYTTLSSSDRFTGTDGAVLRAQVQALDERQKRDNSATNNRIDTLPPRYLLEDVAELKARVRELERKSDG